MAAGCAEASMPDSLIPVGVFGAAHGVRGEVRLKSYTADPADIAAYGPLCDAGRARSFEILSLRPIRDDLFVARVSGISDRNAAAALTNVTLYVPRDRLPAPQEDEFYHADLVGLRAETADGGCVGHVVAVQNFGAGDLLEIAVTESRETLLVPFTKAVVPVIDVAAGRVVVVPPAETEDSEDGAST
jgi:16S rRNA processing protein RimM